MERWLLEAMERIHQMRLHADRLTAALDAALTPPHAKPQPKPAQVQPILAEPHSRETIQ